MIIVHTRSIVLEHLQTFFKDNDRVAITCIYLNYKEQIEQTIPNLISSLLKQIVQDQPQTSDTIRAFYSHHKDRSTRPILDQLVKALQQEIATYFKVFIVVDALDECENLETRSKLLRTLRSFTKIGTVRLMVTSRDLPSITQEVDSIKRIDIRADDKDIERYLKDRIATGPQHLSRLKEDIVSHIVQNAAGM
jgi:hypothetical protein